MLEIHLFNNFFSNKQKFIFITMFLKFSVEWLIVYDLEFSPKLSVSRAAEFLAYFSINLYTYTHTHIMISNAYLLASPGVNSKHNTMSK